MQDKKPDYIPAPVWRYWLVHRNTPYFDSPAMCRAGPRLLGIAQDSERDRQGRPWIAKAWKEINTPGRIDDDLVHIFDCFWHLPDVFDKEALAAVRRARELAKSIYETALCPFNMIGEYDKLSIDHLISIPREMMIPDRLFHRAARLDDKKIDPDSDFLFPDEIAKSLPSPGALVKSIAESYQDFSPRIEHPGGAHGNKSQYSDSNSRRLIFQRDACLILATVEENVILKHSFKNFSPGIAGILISRH
jgi:hypothetical protein